MTINDKRVAFQIRNFEKAITGYMNNEPLARYLARYYKENKQMGSSDRRMTSRFCYNYFRLGNAFSSFNVLDRLVFAEFLCTVDSNLVRNLNMELAQYIHYNIDDKISILIEKYNFCINTVFPLIEYVSNQLSLKDFIKSHFIQPSLFIRIKHGEESIVRESLKKFEIKYNRLSSTTYELPNAVNLQKINGLIGKYEVQDLSSQKTLSFFKIKSGEKWWDACSGSGGKALLLLDNFTDFDLLVSDIRSSILRNLDERFTNANIKNYYRKKILDLSAPVDHLLKGELFDGVLLDVPCSGSGTWGRTPEAMKQFSVEKLNEYTRLQKNIVSNVIPYLKKGGTLVYLTCSIYREENEDVVDYIQKSFNLKLEESKLIKGYCNKADSMFGARLIKYD